MENVRLLVQEEGRAARNLIAFHVDLSKPETGKVLSKKPPSSPRLPSELRMTKRSSVVAKSGSRVRSASTGRDKKSELQARYWAFLFGNLKRAVDEIYQTCETDENVSECKEVILVLENFTRDFHNLIEWFKLKWEYENTPPPQRPTSLAWEVRKSSPGKMPRISSPAQRRLDFSKSQPDVIDDNQSTESVTIDENNYYGLRFGDVVIDKHLFSVRDSVMISSDKSIHENEKNISVSSDTLTVRSDGDEDKEINEKENKIEKDIKSSEDKEVRIEEDIKSSGREKKDAEEEGKGKNVDVNIYVTSDHVDVITTDQASQTESQKSTVVSKNVKNSSLTTKKLFIGSKSTASIPNKPASSPLTSINTKSNVSVGTRKVPMSPTSVAPAKNQTLIHIPGRNVSAAVFVPGKKQATVSPNLQKQSTTALPPSNLLVNVVINSDENEPVKDSSLSKTQNNTVTDSEHNKNESNNAPSIKERNKDQCVEVYLVPSQAVENKSLIDSSCGGVVELKVNVSEVEQQTENNEIKNENLETTLKKVHSENCPAVAEHLPVKIMCDKTVMTDFPLLTSTVPKQPLYRSNSVYRNKTTVISRKANEPISVTSSSNIDAKKPGISTSAAVGNIKNMVTSATMNVSLKKSESLVERPAYSAVSKLYRSKTAVEIRQTSYRRNNQNVKYQNTAERNKQVQPVAQRRHSDGKNMMANSELKKENLSMSANELKKKVISVDDDGWETVKARSRWRLNPLSQSSGNIKLRSMNSKSRYYLPSPATSLPALPVSLDNHEDVSHKPAKFQKDKQNSEILKGSKVNNEEHTVLRSKSFKKDVSEVTISSSVKRSVKNDNAEKGSSLNKRITTRETFKKENVKVPDCKKNGLKEQSPKQSDEGNRQMSGDVLTNMFESNLEEEGIDEEEIRKSKELDEEEKMLTKKIKDLESTEIEVDTETDETETDGEVTVGGEDEVQGRISDLKASYENALQKMSWAEQMDTLDKLEELMALDVSNKDKGTAWKDRMSTLEQLEELVARHPGRALELHQKLSSPSRRRTLPDTIQRYHARQASAKLKREQLLQDKSAKMRELLNKVEEVKMAQAQLIEERKLRLAEKLKRAEENRALHLRSIQRKAHDEEEKLREIAFINELEAQNKRHDFMALCQEQQERLQGILDERQRKQEEKAAKEAAVEERRRILEAERQEKLEKMQERRRKREERIGRELLEKEKGRLELAREKARDREERLQALQAAQLANAEELQKKIQQKQEESARRHEENIEHIRQKALETGALRCSADDVAPGIAPYDTKKHCRVCNVLIDSDVYLLSHLRGKAHKEAVKGHDDPDGVIVDAPADKMDAKIAQDRERQKALRKRCKKIRTRMAQRGDEYLSKQYINNIKKLESSNKGRLMKCIKDVDKLHASQGTGQWPNNAITLLERSLGEINRILDKKNSLDQSIFRDLNGFTTLSNILNLALDIPKNMSPYLPSKCFLTTCNVYSLACSGSAENSKYVVLSNKIALLMDLLLNRLNAVIPDDCCSLVTLPVDPVAGALMRLFALVIGHASENSDKDVYDIAPRVQDIISYCVSVGTVDKLAVYCSSVRDPIDGNQQAAQFLLSAIKLLTTLAQARCGNGKNDPTQLIATLRVTELFGAVSMLYGMLLHQGAAPRDVASPPPALPAHTVAVTKATLCLLKAVAQLDLAMFQRVLGAEGISLQLRHIASYLLWYCCHVNEKELLHQVVEVVGFFAVKHRENQMILQSGYMPTVLQQLCNLPFEYFSNPSLSYLLFPTLLACCHNNPDNRAILEQELSYQLLEDFRVSEAAQNNILIQMLK